MLAETYKFQPRYVGAIAETGEVLAGVPTMLVESRITGRRMIGLPFSDACPPLLHGFDRTDELIGGLLEDYSSQGCAFLELRGGNSTLATAGFQKFEFVRHEIPLGASLDEIEGKLSSAKRRARNRATNEGVEVSRSESIADMKVLYKLYVLTRQKHGLPPAPFSFFENIHRFLIEPGMGCLLVAKWKGQVIAIDLLLWYGDHLYYKFNVWDTRFQEVRPNDLLIWEAIRLGKEKELSVFDLGRCEIENEGLRRFKMGWSANESVLPYYFYPSVRGFTAGAGQKKGHEVAGNVIRRTPPALLARAGFLYRHLA